MQSPHDIRFKSTLPIFVGRGFKRAEKRVQSGHVHDRVEASETVDRLLGETLAAF